METDQARVAPGAAPAVWGVVSMAEAPRWWLAVGAAGNLVVVITWVVSRTVGLPVGEYAGITLPAGFPDGLATALEVVIVAGAAVLMVRGDGPVRSLARSPRVAVAAAVVAAALTLAGVLSQADAYGSSAGLPPNGTGATGPYATGPRAGAPTGGGRPDVTRDRLSAEKTSPR